MLASLATYVRGEIAALPAAGTYADGVRRFWGNPDGTLWISKNLGTAYYIGWLNRVREYFGNPALCRADLRPRYRRLYDMGPGLPPPANALVLSEHCDHNSYLTSKATLEPGTLLVIRGTLPAIPRTLCGGAAAAAREDLRYWGLILATNVVAVVSVVDEELVLDRDGGYTLVIGSAADRPPNADAAHGITWREWPRGDALTLTFRMTSADPPAWPHSPHLIGWDEADYCDAHLPQNRQIVGTRMGRYAPVARHLTRQQVEALDRVGQPPYQRSANACGL